MDLLVKKVKGLYLEKKALLDAIEALKEKQEKVIADDLEMIFKELREDLENTKFILSIHPHYEDAYISIFRSDKKQELDILDFEISNITGEEDAEFQEVIKKVKTFLASLDLKD